MFKFAQFQCVCKTKWMPFHINKNQYSSKFSTITTKCISRFAQVFLGVVLNRFEFSFYFRFKLGFFRQQKDFFVTFACHLIIIQFNAIVVIDIHHLNRTSILHCKSKLMLMAFRCHIWFELTKKLISFIWDKNRSDECDDRSLVLLT